MTTTETQTRRCFIAIPVLEKTVTDELDRLGRQLSKVDNGLWWPEPLYHCTLRFLGDTSADTMDRLLSLDALNAPRKAGASNMHLGLGQTGSFPGSTAVWVGLDGADVERLKALQAEIERLAVDMGFDPAEYSFTPHITVGRFRTEEREKVAKKLADLIAPSFKVRPVAWTPSHVHLMESTRAAGLVNYNSISTAPLQGGAG